MAGQTVVATQLKRAETFWPRFRGLMLRKQFPKEFDALLLSPCNSVHTLFMRFPIDVLFLDKERKIVRISENMPPGRISPVVRTARQVVELAAGTVKNAGISPGDMLTWDETGKVVKK